MATKPVQSQPLISIIVPVFNAGEFFAQALDSILNQTYTNWELVIVDDCSTDGSAELAVAYALRDPRIRVFKTKHRLSVGRVANLAIKQTRGTYIARMDADDIALPDRLSLQLRYLQTHRTAIGVGGQCELIDSENRHLGYRRFPTAPKDVEEMMFYNYPVQSPTFMVRVSKLPKNFVWYEEKVESAEEHELLFKLRQYGEIANTSQVTLKYRIHTQNTSRIHPKKDFFHIFGVRLKAVLKYRYIPSFVGCLKNVGELMVIAVTPEDFLFPAYLHYKKLTDEDKQGGEGWSSWYQ